MYGNQHSERSDALNLQLNNVIEFPKHEQRVASQMKISAENTSLVSLWNRDKDQDALSGVPIAVLEALQRLEEAGRPGALCVLRLDEYRLLEETFGTEIGRKLLVLVGNRLRASLRNHDLLDVIAEDEFVLVVDGQVEEEQLVNIAQRLLRDCNGVYTLDGLRMHVNASLGIARFPLDASEPALLMRFARIALHETNPSSPTPYHFFNQGLLKQLQSRVWMAAELEDALANERFELHYQPLFDIQSQRVLGAEALLRLRTEAGELIAPNHFIPLAEEMGLIVPIGRWVVREACRQLKVWHEQGLTALRMSVNVSPAQLSDDHFVGGVCDAVNHAGIGYQDLELEITEGQMVDYLPLIEKAFKELNAKGVRIAIDDFGTGYSALAYLTRLHWSSVKIDRSFLTHIPEQSKAGRVVSAIIAMAGELGLQVTAEGIETEAQYQFLFQAGCHNGQGFGYAKPHPVDEFLNLIRNSDAMGWQDQSRMDP
ncbi:MAG: bifunctional diguanylate cyclase/phosphodiesterase [Gammaproteobacteria bacterium]|nr:bifunctional diguanylate cyclase/phosphodiesterase [Gammaproteobacteria bacterium]